MDAPTPEEVALAEELLEKYDNGRGISKSQLEIATWGDATAHGRHFDRFVARSLGVSTTRKSKQTDRIDELERQVRSFGRHPVGKAPTDVEVQLQHAREACLLALRIWNDPTSTFRSGGFSLLFVAAWNSLAIAAIQRTGGEWREIGKNGKPSVAKDGVEISRDSGALVAEAFARPDQWGLRENVQFWIDLRNAVAHRHLPAVDALVVPHAQAGLVNIERILCDEFGAEYGIGESLSVPLQLSGFRDPGVLASRKQLFSSLPIGVQSVLSRADSADAALVADPTFMLRVAFIPFVPPSGRSPDSISHFLRPGEVPDELAEALDRYVVLGKPARRSEAQFRAGYVVDEVIRRTGFKFHWNLHASAARTLGAWPPSGKSDRTVNGALAEYNTAFKAWQYSQGWIDLLVEQLASAEGFRHATGKDPVAVETHE